MADLAVRIGFDGAELTDGLKGASRELDSFGSKARANASNIAMVGAAAAAAGVAVVTGLVSKGMQAIDAQADLAAQLKTTSASMAVLQRAGDLSGASMEQITTAGKRLAVVLGEADHGSKKAAETLDRLGLSSAAVAAMPLDERINAVNEAIKANIPVTQQAAVAAQLFGKEAGFAVSQISGEALSQARHEAELFGLAISDVDAAKVQQAADEFGKIGLLTDGVIQQLTVNLAPAITAVMRMFTETAEEAGGVGTSVANASGIGIKAFGFLMDVIEGVRRTFAVLGKSAALGFLYIQESAGALADTIINFPVNAINVLIAGLNKLPGINIEPVGLSALGENIRKGWQEAYVAIQAAKADIAETLAAPMPSGTFARYVEEAKAAAEEAAKVAAAVTGGGTGDGGSSSGEGKAEKSPAQEKVDLELSNRLASLREANMTELQLLADKQMQELETINAGWEQKLLTDESWNVMLKETKARHEDEMTELEQRAADARTQIAEAEAAAKKKAMMTALGQMSTLMNSESRKMFEIGKVAAIASAAIAGKEAVILAWKSGMAVGGPWAPVVAAGYAAAAATNAAGMIASIRSQSFGGGGAGAQATGSNTAAVNAASTPVGGGAGGPSGGTLTVQGLSAGSLFTGDAVAQLAEELLSYQRRGGSVVLAG